MAKNTNHAEHHFYSALNFIQSFNFELAEKELLLANQLCPNRISILINLSHVLINLNKWSENIAICEKILSAEPHNLEGQLNIAISYHHLGQGELAHYFILHALKTYPNSDLVWSNFGNIALYNKKYAKAEECFKKALSLNPRSGESYIGLSNLSNELGRYQDGISYLDSALAINPTNPLAIWNKSLSLLRLGDFKNGWRLYESRWKLFSLKQSHKELPTKLWLGEESIKDKVIHIYSEQGYGDVIQMARFLPVLESKFKAKVIFETSHQLFELVNTVSPTITVIKENEKPISSDGLTPTHHCPIMSLPLSLQIEVKSIPKKIPYLYSEPSKTLVWADRLSGQSKINTLNRNCFRIGLCTKGSGHYAGIPNNKRDIPGLRVNEILTACQNQPIEFHLLNLTKDDSIYASENLIDNTLYIKDFSDTAGLLMQLDLIISIDTAVAHLAGALGKSVLVMLPNQPDFLSGINNSHSFWYPQMEYLRQPKPGEWPIEQLINKILLLFKSSY